MYTEREMCIYIYIYIYTHTHVHTLTCYQAWFAILQMALAVISGAVGGGKEPDKGRRGDGEKYRVSKTICVFTS